MPAHKGLSAILLADRAFRLDTTSPEDGGTVQNCSLFGEAGQMLQRALGLVCPEVELTPSPVPTAPTKQEHHQEDNQNRF